jgi:hypothetical protein
MTPEEFHAHLEQVRGTEKLDPVKLAARLVLMPAVRANGPAELEPLKAAAEDGDQVLCEALVAYAMAVKISVLDVIPERTLAAAALRAVITEQAEGEWALYALTYGHLEPEDRWRIVTRLADEAPDDDDALWLIGDGVVAGVQMDPVLNRRLDEYARSNPRMRRILHLVETIP